MTNEPAGAGTKVVTIILLSLAFELLACAGCGLILLAR